MWMWTIALAVGASPEDLAAQLPDARVQLEACVSSGCEPASGARAAWMVALGTYMETGVADGELTAAVRTLDPALFSELPEVLQDAATNAPEWSLSATPAAGEPPTSALAAVPGPSRVIVVDPENSRTLYLSKRLQRQLRSAIDEPEARIGPAFDLYQEGLRHQTQPGAVADAVKATAATSLIADDALSPQDWRLKAHELRHLSQRIGFVGDPEPREALFGLYVQMGRAADLSRDPAPPFFELVGGEVVNYGYYQAARLASEEPRLRQGLDPRQLPAVQGLLDWIDSDKAPMRTLSFASDSLWSAKAFATEYELFVNGLEMLMTNDKGHLKVPQGTIDVRLERVEGPSLSERLDITSGTPDVYLVLDTAHRATNMPLALALGDAATDCEPWIEPDLLKFIATYDSLEPGSQTWLALGSAKELWHFDAESGKLARQSKDCP